MSSVGNTLAKIDPGPALKSVGKTIESGVREIGKGAEGLGREVGKVGQAAINDPVGTTLKVAAIATQQYWALPLISAGTVVANGGSIEDAVKAGAISYAASVIAVGIADGLNEAFANELTSSVGDASLQATNRLADGSIQHVFTDGSTIVQGVNGAISTTAATVAPSIASQLPVGMLQSINTAMANAGGSAAMTALQGGDLNEILLSGVSSGAGSFAGTQTTAQLKDLGLNSKVAQVLGRTTGAATSGAVQGQDASQIFNTALVNNIVRTSLSEAGTALKNTDVAKGLTKSLNETIQPFKDSVNNTKQSFLDQAKKLTDLQTEADSTAKSLIEQGSVLKTEAETYANENVNPAATIANKAYETATASFSEYKSASDEFGELVKKYDEAKAANNIELANQYADQANALIPKVNAATEKYNADYNAYDVAKNDFESKNQTYLGYVDKLTNLNNQYTSVYKPVEDQLAIVKENADGFNTSVEEMQNTLNQQAKNVEEAYTKASDYSPIAKSTFEKLYGETGDLTRASTLSEQINVLPENNQRMYEFATNFGLRPEDAIQFAPDVSKMSLVAAQTFYDSLSQNPDAASAFNTANKINSLNDAQQDSFYNAKLKGLDTAQALDVANSVGGASREQQNIYIDSVKSGLGGPLASLFSAAQGLTGSGTQLQDINDVNLAQLKTQEAKDAYRYYTYGGLGSDQALTMAKGQDDAILAQGTGSQTASTNNIGYLPPVKTQFGDTHYWDKEKNQWMPVPTEGVETGGIGGGTGLDLGVSGNSQQGPLSQTEIDQYKAEGVSESDIQKLVEKYGVAGSATPTNTDYYQSLIDKIFADKNVKAKTLATQAPSTGGQTPTPGGQTPTQPSVLPEGYSYTAPPMGIYTTVQPKDGYRYAYGPSGDRIEVPVTGGSGGTQPGTGGGGGGTQPGTGGGGGTEPGAGGGGGTQPGTGAGGGTGGTGTGGFGIGGIGGGGFAIPGGMGLLAQDATGGIKNLTAGLTNRMDYNLSGLPSDEDMVNPMYNAPQIIQHAADGGAVYDPFSTKDTAGGSGISGALTPSLTKAQLNYILTGLPDYLQRRADGGHIEGHNPQFYSEGGLNSLENRYVKGDGDGTSDDVPAMLANGEFVIPADVVSKLGNGSNDAGANVLDEFLQVIRKHAQNHDPKKLPPDSKGPLAYLIDAQRRAKA
jgi:hypothetical protein